MMLLGQYLARVLAFTFRGSVRQTDSWQIVAGGTAIPSIVLGGIYGIMGRDVPSISPTEWATLFGYGLVTWLGIRFLIAPFFIWREQYEEAAELRLELSKPERLVLHHLAKHRAKARAKLSAALETMQTLAYVDQWTEITNQMMGERATKVRNLEAQAGLSEVFVAGRKQLMRAIFAEAKLTNQDQLVGQESQRILSLLQRHLMDDVTTEGLALQLLRDTELKTQQ